jgi:hypothetical protein
MCVKMTVKEGKNIIHTPHPISQFVHFSNPQCDKKIVWEAMKTRLRKKNQEFDES